MKEEIRIAAGQGFWGDLPDAPVRQVQDGPIDYLMLDYLAEVTMSIMQKQRARDPNAGFAAGEPVLYALRDIRAGEEVCFDYSTAMSEAGWELECRCGAAGCRGVVRAWKR